jgi:hypothetical protein
VAIFSRLFRFIRRHPVVVVSALLLIASYSASYRFRRQLGLVHPMANLAYYYYGARPNTLSDRALYWFYFPTHLFGDRLGIHWSDAQPPFDASYF